MEAADHKHCTCTTQGIYCRVGIGLLSAREEGPKEGAYLRMLAFLHQEAIKELNWDWEVWAPATGPLQEIQRRLYLLVFKLIDSLEERLRADGRGRARGRGGGRGNFVQRCVRTSAPPSLRCAFLRKRHQRQTKGSTFPSLSSIWDRMFQTTGSGNETPHRKWGEIDLQPSCWLQLALPGWCLVSLLFL